MSMGADNIGACLACEETLIKSYDDNFCSKKCYDEQWNENPINELINGRIKKGYIKYNKVMPVDDGRDWVEEALEEILDACVYVANSLIILRGKLKK